MERSERIELSYQRWQRRALATVLRPRMVETIGVEPMLPVCRTGVLAAELSPHSIDRATGRLSGARPTGLHGVGPLFAIKKAPQFPERLGQVAGVLPVIRPKPRSIHGAVFRGLSRAASPMNASNWISWCQPTGTAERLSTQRLHAERDRANFLPARSMNWRGLVPASLAYELGPRMPAAPPRPIHPPSVPTRQVEPSSATTTKRVLTGPKATRK